MVIVMADALVLGSSIVILLTSLSDVPAVEWPNQVLLARVVLWLLTECAGKRKQLRTTAQSSSSWMTHVVKAEVGDAAFRTGALFSLPLSFSVHQGHPRLKVLLASADREEGKYTGEKLMSDKHTHMGTHRHPHTTLHRHTCT